MNDIRHWIALCESMEHDFDGYLYHATSAEKLDNIQDTGLQSGSYWGTAAIVEYYIETIEDEGKTPVVLKALLSAFDPTKLAPDRPGLEEPITTVVGMNEQQVWKAWKKSKQTWQDCLNLIGSVRYNAIMRCPPAVVDD